MTGVYNYIAAVHTERIYGRASLSGDGRSRSSAAAADGGNAVSGRRNADCSELFVLVIRAVKDYYRRSVNGKPK